jgi:hypothetical protein
MPPKQDYQLVSSDEFNNDKLWIFMDVQKFRNGECGGNASNVSFAQAYYGTSWTSLFDLPEGLLVDVIYVPHDREGHQGARSDLHPGAWLLPAKHQSAEQ